jgi:alkylhydroperoxidase family enzyme
MSIFFKERNMAFIGMLDQAEIPERNRVSDTDNIIQVHSINSNIMKIHYDLYVSLMRKSGPISRRLREMIAIVVSSINKCNY